MDPEPTLLGAILAADGALQTALLVEAAELLPTDFGDGRCRDVFAAIRALDADESPISLLTVRGWLEGRKARLDAAWLGALVDGVPRVESLRFWAEAIVRRSTARLAAVRAQRLVEELQQAALDPNGRDAQETIDRLADLGRVAAARLAPTEGARELADVLPEVVENLDEYRTRGGIQGLSTGLPDLDAKIGGLRPSMLYIIGARTADGKSTLAGQIGADVARGGDVVVVFSLEMAADSLAERVVIREANTPKRDTITSEVAWERVGRAAESLALDRPPLFLVDKPGLTVAQMRGYVEGVRRRAKRVDLVVVDHAQIIAHPAEVPADESRYLALRLIAEELREMARAIRAPVVLMSQVNPPREGKDDREPRLSDLRESSDLQNTADVVVLVHHRRDNSNNPREITESKLIVAKNRYGVFGDVAVRFDGARNTFQNLARYEPEGTRDTTGERNV